MLTSLALIFLLGLLLGAIFKRLNLPGLLGMLVTGMILGPYAFDLLDAKIMSISPELRQLALVIILVRAGLSLDLKDLKKVGRPALLMCFLPSSLEIIGFLLLAPPLFHITLLEAAIMGSVVAAVSPAVIIPRMIRLIEGGYGTKNSVPSLILAGTSVDDVYVIVLFTAFTSLATGKQVSPWDFGKIPVSILTGLLAGALAGYGLAVFFRKFHMRDTVKVVIVLGISFLLIELGNRISSLIPMSGLLAIVSMSAVILRTYEPVAKRLASKFNKLWVAAEVIVFVLVGASVNPQALLQAGGFALLIIAGGLIFRMLGVLLCLLRTELDKNERLFCMLAYTPKASVQAAIGTIPLTMGLACGDVVLTAAVLSILLTAPLGAFAIDRSYQKLLQRKNDKVIN